MVSDDLAGLGAVAVVVTAIVAAISAQRGRPKRVPASDVGDEAGTLVDRDGKVLVRLKWIGTNYDCGLYQEHLVELVTVTGDEVARRLATNEPDGWFVVSVNGKRRYPLSHSLATFRDGRLFIKYVGPVADRNLSETWPDE